VSRISRRGRERVVRMVLEHAEQPESRWAAISSLGLTICAALPIAPSVYD